LLGTELACGPDIGIGQEQAGPKLPTGFAPGRCWSELCVFLV
jgi:hypothetical protein